jgi:hypothetical protein
MPGGSIPAVLLAAAIIVAAASSSRAQDTRPEEQQSGEQQRSAEQQPLPEQQPFPDQQPLPEQQRAEQPQSAEQQQSAEQRPAADEAPASEPEADIPYTVECGPDPEEGRNVCFVDRETYVGWRTFHAICHTCHAQDAVGSTFAPALLPRVREMDRERFSHVLENGFTGQTGVMPAFGENPNVNRYYEELWSYLRARSDGALLPGRPQRLPE